MDLLEQNLYIKNKWNHNELYTADWLIDSLKKIDFNDDKILLSFASQTGKFELNASRHFTDGQIFIATDILASKIKGKSRGRRD